MVNDIPSIYLSVNIATEKRGLRLLHAQIALKSEVAPCAAHAAPEP